MQENLFDVNGVIRKILEKNNKYFMRLTELRKKFPKDLSNQLGFNSSSSLQEVQEILEPYVKNCFSFYKKGRVIYIAPDVAPLELLLKIISEDPKNAKSAKKLFNLIPLSKSEFTKILNELSSLGHISMTINERFEPKIFIKTSDFDVKSLQYEKISPTNFLKAFDELERGKIFVRICDLRKKLNWPREEFDNMLIKLRDNETIQLHEGDVTLMTNEEIENGFVDENNFRMGTVIRYDK